MLHSVWNNCHCDLQEVSFPCGACSSHFGESVQSHTHDAAGQEEHARQCLCSFRSVRPFSHSEAGQVHGLHFTSITKNKLFNWYLLIWLKIRSHSPQNRWLKKEQLSHGLMCAWMLPKINSVLFKHSGLQVKKTNVWEIYKSLTVLLNSDFPSKPPFPST